MKTYLDYKNQIEGFEDVSETVKAMEKISASSVHFLKQKVANLNTYASEIESVMAELSLFYQNKNSPLLQENTSGKKTLIILSGERGLVGGLWHNLIGAFLETGGHYQSIIVAGAKGENYLKEEGARIEKKFANPADGPEISMVEEITDYIFSEFKNKTFSRVDILYPRFVSLAKQQPVFIPFLPFVFNSPKEAGSETEPRSGLPIFEPSKKEVFKALTQKYIGMFFRKIVMETKLSELSARTVAMEHASAKTDELIKKISLNYLKERRRAITQKQLESFAVHKII